MRALSQGPVVDERALHAVLLLAVCFALYPVLWVVSLALSPSVHAVVPRAIPLPEAPSLDELSCDHFRQGTNLREWLFGRQLLNSILVSVRRR
jgi:arabinogalactan oligomer/maltooligosaccharide transport system permease protein